MEWNSWIIRARGRCSGPAVNATPKTSAPFFRIHRFLPLSSAKPWRRQAKRISEFLLTHHWANSGNTIHGSWSGSIPHSFTPSHQVTFIFCVAANVLKRKVRSSASWWLDLKTDSKSGWWSDLATRTPTCRMNCCCGTLGTNWAMTEPTKRSDSSKLPPNMAESRLTQAHDGKWAPLDDGSGDDSSAMVIRRPKSAANRCSPAVHDKKSVSA